MANLTRYLQKIFAENSNQIGVFGTGVNKETSTNVETLQSAAYASGWSSAIITNKNYPIWQERDGVDYGFSYQLAYLLQKGIPDWIATETYYTNDYCKLGSDIYYSLQDNNIGQNPAGTTGYWKLASGADTDLSNLTTAGNARLQYAPFSINNGTVTNGENATLYAPTESTTVEVSWTRPNLSANGTMGGSSFAVSTNSTYNSSYPAWKAVDGSTASGNGCITAENVYIDYRFYNPTALKVTQLTVTNISGTGYTGAITGGKVYGSNDNSTWTELTTFTNSSASWGATWTIDLSTNTSFYNYYKLLATDKSTTQGTVSLYTGFGELGITATYQETVSTGTSLICRPCTITTADGKTKTFDESSVYTISSTPVTREVAFSQPALSANGTLGGSSFAVDATSPYSSSYQIYYMFDGSTSTQYESSTSSPKFITFYNPDALKVTKLEMYNRLDTTSRAIKNYTVYGSNDNSTWTSLTSGTNTVSSDNTWWTINLSDNNNFYNYYKISVDSINGASIFELGQVKITAVYEVTESDADGAFKVFKNFNTGNLSLVSKLTISKTAPSTPSSNDSWLDISTTPANLKIYNNGLWGENNNYVYIGGVTITTGAITDVTNREFNDSGYAINKYYLGEDTPHIVSSYVNGMSGYNIWSNKYCEQWGIVTSSSQTTVYLLKAYADTNYIILSGLIGNAKDYTPAFQSKTASSFVGGSTGSGYTWYWATKGYIA